jgi:hypothetical protein
MAPLLELGATLVVAVSAALAVCWPSRSPAPPPPACSVAAANWEQLAAWHAAAGRPVGPPQQAAAFNKPGAACAVGGA